MKKNEKMLKKSGNLEFLSGFCVGASLTCLILYLIDFIPTAYTTITIIISAVLASIAIIAILINKNKKLKENIIAEP